MPKLKTRKAAAKRFRITKTGKVMRRHTRLRHILEWKTARQRRKLKKVAVVSHADTKRIKEMIHG